MVPEQVEGVGPTGNLVLVMLMKLPFEGLFAAPQGGCGAVSGIPTLGAVWVPTSCFASAMRSGLLGASRAHMLFLMPWLLSGHMNYSPCPLGLSNFLFINTPGCSRGT